MNVINSQTTAVVIYDAHDTLSKPCSVPVTITALFDDIEDVKHTKLFISIGMVGTIVVNEHHCPGVDIVARSFVDWPFLSTELQITNFVRIQDSNEFQLHHYNELLSRLLTQMVNLKTAITTESVNVIVAESLSALSAALRNNTQ